MFGDISAWFCKVLAGIKIDQEKPGFESFVIRPNPVGDLKFVQVEYNSIRGRIASNWKIKKDRFYLNVTIPPNTSATVYVPSRSAQEVFLIESGKRKIPAGNIDGVEFLKTSKGYAVYSVSSGTYTFAGVLGAKHGLKKNVRRS